jgi:hypothetical protein
MQPNRRTAGPIQWTVNLLALTSWMAKLSKEGVSFHATYEVSGCVAYAGSDRLCRSRSRSGVVDKQIRVAWPY